jgi:hypothetical protein
MTSPNQRGGARKGSGRKPFTLRLGDDPAKYAPCDIAMKLATIAIEDHPNFSKPDVRFRHARIKTAFRQLKASGIETFIVSQTWIIPH